MFRSKDNIVLSAKIFTENIIGNVVSTEPNLKINKIKDDFDKNFKHICLGISASGPTKRWAIKNYIELCNKLSKNKKCKFYLAGSNSDISLINEFKNSDIGKNSKSFETLSISETLPLIKNCDCYVGSDTGFAHLAVALGVKSITLFMDSPVLAYGKYSSRMIPIEPEGEKNSTTHNTFGKDKISIEEVLSTVNKVLD